MASRDDVEKLRRFLRLGAGAAIPATAATGLGLLFGPPGAIAGTASVATAQAVMREVGADFADRQLSELQQQRVRQLLLLIGDRIHEKKQHQSREVRSDRFFVEEFGNRSMAVELTEGVLLAAQLEYEERKLPYLANLYAFLVFEPEVGRMQANMLIGVAQELSFTQYRLLALFGQPERIKDLHGWYGEYVAVSPQTLAVLTEVLPLAQ